MIFRMSNDDMRHHPFFKPSDEDSKPSAHRSSCDDGNDQTTVEASNDRGNEFSVTNTSETPGFSEKNTDEMIQLPFNFSPGPNDIICGRARNALLHKGNRRYHDLIYSSLDRYLDASTKFEKSLTITSILKEIHDTAPEGGFVRKIGDHWYKVSNNYAREKCGQR
jgi:hypothetical protein